ncbi:MAG: hypothetical protein AB9900_04715 [Humidesulfovibrio sp.]
MNYAECDLIDRGFRLVEGDMPLPEIWGLDNTGDQAFYHAGIVGYPDNALMCIDRVDRTKTLAILPDGAALPEGGTEILAADVVDLLLTEYGWPEGTTLVDGLPVAPERAR